MDRRQFLTTASATAAGLAVAAPSSAQTKQANQAAPGDAKLNALFDKQFNEVMDNAPGFATALGLDKGPKAALRRTFQPENLQASRAKQLARVKKGLAEL